MGGVCRLCPMGRVMRINLYRLFIGLIATRLTQPVGKEGKQDTWNTGKEKSESPLPISKTCDNTTRDETNHQADERTRRPAAHDLCSLRATEIVAQHSCTSRVVTSLADAQNHA